MQHGWRADVKTNQEVMQWNHHHDDSSRRRSPLGKQSRAIYWINQGSCPNRHEGPQLPPWFLGLLCCTDILYQQTDCEIHLQAPWDERPHCNNLLGRRHIQLMPIKLVWFLLLLWSKEEFPLQSRSICESACIRKGRRAKVKGQRKWNGTVDIKIQW